MFLKLAVILVIVQSVLCRPQITFQDGKFGVNFGGYHAEAGLGGLLTGNAADGALSASAGTPFGQQAGAGIGGSLQGQGRSGGGGYAGASAGGGVGASAAFGGTLDGQTGGGGGVGAESHIPGKQTKVVKLSQIPVNTNTQVQKTIVSGNVQQPLKVRGQFEENSGNDEVVFTKTITRTRPHVRKHKKKTQQQEIQVQDDEVEYGQYDNTQTNNNNYNANNNGNNFDYRNFLDFGFFSNTAAGFGGPVIPASGPTTTYTKTISIPKQVNIVKKLYVPVPTFQVQKRIHVPPPPPPPPPPPKYFFPVPRFSFRKHWFGPQIRIEKHWGSGVPTFAPLTVDNRGHTATKTSAQVQTTQDTSNEKSNAVEINKRIEIQQSYAPVEHQQAYYGPAKTATVTKTIQARNGFYDDIFNIPISTLSAVSSFLSNNAGGGASVHKTITYG